MLTTQKWVLVFPASLGLMLVLAGLSGCKPAGASLAHEGARLIEQGKYERAIAKLVAARERLPGNAQVWNHLGLAYHGAYQINEAIIAYQQALNLDPNLAAAHYNLGCLWLEQSEYARAAEQLKSYTLLRPESVDGWLRLATAQLRDRKLDAAERSFGEVLKRSPGNVEALNSMGVLYLQRKRVREAAQSFSAALTQNPNYGPSLLNLAVVYHQHLNNRQLALQKYREYLALGTPPNAPAVQETVRQLEQELQASSRSPTTNQPAQIPLHTSPSRPTNLLEQAKPPTPVTPAPQGRITQVPKVASTPQPEMEIPARPPKASEPDAQRAGEQRAAGQQPVEPTLLPEKAQAATKPETSPPPELTSEGRLTAGRETNAPEMFVQGRPKPIVESAKPSPWRHLNPANWFASEKPAPMTTPLPPLPQARTTSTFEVAARIPPEAPVKSEDVPLKIVRPAFARYSYISPAKPKPGNRIAAEKQFAAGVRAHRNRRLAEAVAAYEAAIRADPAYFDAYYNWALAAYELGDLKAALAANEYALAIDPSSADARYNFALALDQARYPIDAANELEKVIRERPDETRAYLNLGNLYAQTLNQPQQARSNYTKVLQLNPRHPQATSIRYWLTANP